MKSKNILRMMKVAAMVLTGIIGCAFTKPEKIFIKKVTVKGVVYQLYE